VPYFFNTESQQSVWEPPSGLTQEEIDALPGAELLKVKDVRAKEVRASHILVKHSGSRRPSSWKEAGLVAFTPSFVLLTPSFDDIAQYHALKGGGHHDPERLQSEDRDEHGRVWLARAQALGLFIA
jgi:NIMA-interacting peptidyl-prolyl cis-trans isomerase 1